MENTTVETIKAAVSKVLAEQGQDLSEKDRATISAISKAADQAESDWKSGKIQQIGKPGVPRVGGVRTSDVEFQLSQDTGLSITDAYNLIADVLYNA